jgi:hypothetical protein
MDLSSSSSPTGFVWAVSVLDFFRTLSHHGATYVKNDPAAREIIISLPLDDEPLFTCLRRIFKNRIPVDCSLYVQIILQKDMRNCNVAFGIGIFAEVILVSCSGKLGARYYYPANQSINKILATSSCEAKGQWVVVTPRGSLVGMTSSGPLTLTDAEWSAHIADGINKWLEPSGARSLEQIKKNIAAIQIEIIMRDESVKITKDTIISRSPISL